MTNEQLIASLRGTLSDAIATIDGHVASPAPAPAPAPTAPPDIHLPITYQLFGPVQANGALVSSAGGTFAFAGNALSASTKLLLLPPGTPKVHWARIVAVWTPGSANNRMRLVHADFGPENIVEVGVMQGANTASPIVSASDATPAINGLIDAGTPYKQFGFQMAGDGTQYTIYEVRLEVVWKFPRA